MTRTITNLAGSLRRLPVRWATVALFALVLNYADGFWVTVIQITIGAIERTEPPLARWLRDASLMLPLVFVAVVAALLLARRWVHGRREGRTTLLAAALLITLISGGVGIAEVAASSAYDYSFQTKHLELMHSYANQQKDISLAGFGAASSLQYTLYCNLRGVAASSPVALMEYATLMLHVRALMFATMLILATNLIVVALVLAVWRDRLWAVRAASRWPAVAAASGAVAAS